MQQKLAKISMILIKQPDLEAAVNFYKNLGFELKFEIKGVWAEFDVAGLKLGLCPAREPLSGERTGIVFDVADVKAFYEDYKNTLDFLSEPVERVHGIMVSFRDPGGNILDIYQATPHKVKDYLSSLKVDTPDEGLCCGKQSPCCSSDEENSCSGDC